MLKLGMIILSPLGS